MVCQRRRSCRRVRWSRPQSRRMPARIKRMRDAEEVYHGPVMTMGSERVAVMAGHVLSAAWMWRVYEPGGMLANVAE